MSKLAAEQLRALHSADELASRLKAELRQAHDARHVSAAELASRDAALASLGSELALIEGQLQQAASHELYVHAHIHVHAHRHGAVCACTCTRACV